MNNINKKLLFFFESNKEKLIQVYITERQNHQEIGALFNFIKDNEVKSSFYPISSNIITDDVKKDILEKNNYRNTFAFFYLIDVDTNTIILTIEDLEKTK